MIKKSLFLSLTLFFLATPLLLTAGERVEVGSRGHYKKVHKPHKRPWWSVSFGISSGGCHNFPFGVSFSHQYVSRMPPPPGYVTVMPYPYPPQYYVPVYVYPPPPIW